MASKTTTTPASAVKTESKFAKAFQFSPDINKMETLDLVFWFRQIVGFSIGVSAGMLHLTGMYVVIGFLVAIMTLSNIYAYKVLNVSDEDFQNNELSMEGVPNAAGIFFVSRLSRLS